MIESQASTRIVRLNSIPLSPVNQAKSTLSSWFKFNKDAYTNRRVIFLLAKREIRQRYKGSILGIFWSLGRPLLQLFIYFVVIGEILGASRGIPNFALYIFAGLSIWTLFSEVFGSTSSSIEQNSGLIKKVSISPNVFPLSGALGGSTNFIIQFILLIVASAIVGINLNFEVFGLLLLSVLGLFFFSLGIGLLVASSSVYIRDIKHFSELAIGILFWLSPIVYPVTLVEEFLGKGLLFNIYLINPITSAAMCLQRFAWNGRETMSSDIQVDFSALVLASFGFSVISLLVCQLVFSKLQRNFGQEL